MERAFSPYMLLSIFILGRCPRLGWKQAFGLGGVYTGRLTRFCKNRNNQLILYHYKMDSKNIRRGGRFKAPKASLYLSLGQRPRNVKKTHNKG